MDNLNMVIKSIAQNSLDLKASLRIFSVNGPGVWFYNIFLFLCTDICCLM